MGRGEEEIPLPSLPLLPFLFIFIFFALAPIFARPKSGNCFKRTENPTETLTMQATSALFFPECSVVFPNILPFCE